MGTVFIANVFGQSLESSDDFRALYDQQNILCMFGRELGLEPLSAFVDFTDVEVNHEITELPEGMTSSDHLMIASGVWCDLSSAHDNLKRLRDHLATERPRLGLIRNQLPEVLKELDTLLAFMSAHSGTDKRFNLAVVE